jgi:hypothetical protein
MDVSAENPHFIKYPGNVARGKINYLEIDEGGPTDSKTCLSEEARRRVVKIAQNQIEQ